MDRHPKDTPRRGPVASWARRPGRLLAVAFALFVLLLGLVLPVGAMFLRSFQVVEVALRSGGTHRALGEVEHVRDSRGDWLYVYGVKTQAGEVEPVRKKEKDVARVRTVFSLDHYRNLLTDARSLGLLEHSTLLAAGGALLALLIGLPVAWLLARTDLPARRVWTALVVGPAILPPFFVAMGGVRAIGGNLHRFLGLENGALQLTNAAIVFGLTLFPLVALLVGRALAEVPVGPYEAARLLGGRRAAWRRVVLPALLPAVFGSMTLVFLLAWSDFGVPDLLGFMMPTGSTPVHVFPTEVLLQWKQNANSGRAVATGAPFVVLTAVLLLLAILWLRRSPVVAGGEGRRGRPRVRLRARGKVVATASLILLLAASLVLPLYGVARWGLGAGETVANPGGGPAPSAREGHLFDFASAFAHTPGAGEDLVRWIKSGLGAALLATIVAVILVRWARDGGRLARATVLGLGAMPLAVPGLVFTVGTVVLWTRLDVPFVERGMTRSILVLTARFLPFALLAVWLALRQVRRGNEDAARILGAGPLVRFARVWGPLAGRGVLGGALVVLVLALREIEAVMLVDPRIYPLRIYDKIHFSRLADEANLTFVYVGLVLLPGLLAAFLLARRRDDAR